VLHYNPTAGGTVFGGSTLSACDLAGIAIMFAWALEGVDPYPPTQPSVTC
jgi:hypothetical protein